METLKAIITSGVVTNIVVVDPDNHANISGVLVPDGMLVAIGWSCAGTTFTPPLAPPKTAAQVKAEINAAYAAAISVITGEYPESERNSWAKQESEARAYVANAQAPTPLLSAIATARGITVGYLAGRVIEKADEFAVYAGLQIGRRRVRMDTIAAADQAALEALVW